MIWTFYYWLEWPPSSHKWKKKIKNKVYLYVYRCFNVADPSVYPYAAGSSGASRYPGSVAPNVNVGLSNTPVGGSLSSLPRRSSPTQAGSWPYRTGQTSSESYTANSAPPSSYSQMSPSASGSPGITTNSNNKHLTHLFLNYFFFYFSNTYYIL